MTGYVRTDVTDQIANGNTIDAIPLDQEFDAITSAFTSVSGHRHNGSVGEGAPITVVGPVQDLIVSASSVTPKTDNTLDLGAVGKEFKDLYITGVANIGSLVADTADINAGTVDATTIGATTPSTGAFTTLSSSGAATLASATVGGVAATTASNTQTLTGKTINLADNTLITTSAQLAAAVTDETGTGPLVFGSNPSFTGIPTTTTAAVNTNNTQIASTAFVVAQIADDAPTKTGGGASGSWTINAATATLLQTPRTVNGTLFSGAADIISSFWGAARNFTIGITTKAVDGSANVGWTLAEIGAQPILTGLTTSVGFLVQTAANVFTSRVFSASANTGVTISDGDGVSTNPVIAGVTQTQAVWDAGTSTTESVVSPAKLTQATGQVFFLQESTANGVGSSVTLTATTWVKRLVTSVVNTITGASVASGVITLPAGTYQVSANAGTTIDVTSESVLRVRNTTAGTTSVIGRYTRERDEGGGQPGSSSPIIDGVFVLATTSNIELQQWSLTTLGGGSGSPATGEAEVHASMTIYKIR